MPVPVYPSATNTYVASMAASDNLFVSYSRNVTDFALNRWVQIRPISVLKGLYARKTIEVAGRLTSTDGAEFKWADGALRPTGVDNTESFTLENFHLQRYDYPVTLGTLTVDQAPWEIDIDSMRDMAQLAMTSRTQEAINVVTNAANFDAGNVSAVTSIPGVSGTWAASTAARLDILKSMQYAWSRIKLRTLGAVRWNQLRLVMGPDVALAISQTQEVRDYLKSSPVAVDVIRGTLFDQEWMIPRVLYGVELVVEDTAKVTTKKGGTQVYTWAWPAGTVAMVSRVGALESNAPLKSPTYSTVQMFVQEDMNVETWVDERNRLWQGHIVDTRTTVVTAPISGFLFTGAV